MGTSTPINPYAIPYRLSVCWSCGAHTVKNGAKYCTHCENTGRADPWINCTTCGAARKRHVPGEQQFTCTRCKEKTA